jgi:hypothetical protein
MVKQLSVYLVVVMLHPAHFYIYGGHHAVVNKEQWDDLESLYQAQF